MFSLLIETATERGIVSIMQGGRKLFHRELPYGLSSSKFMITAIAEGLQLLEMNPKELSFIAAGIGPGSYTGIRVAAATAQSMAYALKIPVVGVSTLECFIPAQDGRFAVLVDAKIGGAYFLVAECIQGQIVGSSLPAVLPLDQLGSFLKAADTIVTPNSTVLRPKLEAIYGDYNLNWLECAPDSLQMEKIASEKLLHGEVAKRHTLDLLYLRKSQAEEAKQEYL